MTDYEPEIGDVVVRISAPDVQGTVVDVENDTVVITRLGSDIPVPKDDVRPA